MVSDIKQATINRSFKFEVSIENLNSNGTIAVCRQLSFKKSLLQVSRNPIHHTYPLYDIGQLPEKKHPAMQCDGQHLTHCTHVDN